MTNIPPRNFSDATSSLERAAAERPEDSARHLRWIQNQLEAVERGELDAVLRDAHDDVTLDVFAPTQLPFVAKAHGKAELLAALAHNFAAVEDQRPHINDIFTDGDTVVLFGREQGTVRSTGVRYDVEFVERLTFRDGRLASVRIVVAEAVS